MTILSCTHLKKALTGCFLAALVLLLLPAPALGAAGGWVAYRTDFSADPGWLTNNPGTNYWDEEKGMFHYLMRDGSGAYVNVKVPYGGESFTLSWDILPERTDYQARVKFGLGDNDQVTDQRLTMFTELENGRYGRILWLRSIDGQNQRREVSSYFLSYDGPTVQFADGTWYHAVMEYREDRRTLTLTVTQRNDSRTLWHYTLDSVSIFPTMDRIYMSKLGDYTNPNAIAEGYLDNVVFTLLEPESPAAGTVPASAPSTPEEAVSRAATQSVTEAPAAKPAKTTAAIPLPASLALCGAALATLLAGRKPGKR